MGDLVGKLEAHLQQRLAELDEERERLQLALAQLCPAAKAHPGSPPEAGSERRQSRGL